MEIPWQLTNGEEYPESVAQARSKAPDPERFDGQLEVLRRFVRTFPFEGHYFAEARVHIREVVDEAKGYRLSLGYSIIRDRWCVIARWVQLGNIEDEDVEETYGR